MFGDVVGAVGKPWLVNMKAGAWRFGPKHLPFPGCPQLWVPVKGDGAVLYGISVQKFIKVCAQSSPAVTPRFFGDNMFPPVGLATDDLEGSQSRAMGRIVL